MRKNVQDAYRRWRQGDDSTPAQRGTSIWSNGRDIYSYATCLLTNTPDGRVIMNATRYSVTTTQQQNSLLVLLNRDGFVFETVDDLDRGVDREALRKAADDKLLRSA